MYFLFQNSKQRMRFTEQVQESHESELVKKRQLFALRKFGKEQREVIASNMMKKIPIFVKKYSHTVESGDFDEISRRFSMLTHSFVAQCIEEADGEFHYLEFLASAAEVVAQTIRIMTFRVILLPEIPPIQCALVRTRLSESITRTITMIKDERLRNEQQNHHEHIESTGILGGADKENETDGKSVHVGFADSADVADEIGASDSAHESRVKEFKEKKKFYQSNAKTKFVCKSRARYFF